MKHIIESIPILLAVYAAIVCARQYMVDRRKHHKRVLLIGVVSSLLLIIAQTSWYVTYVVQGNLAGTWFADQIWTAFNSLTMLAFILLAHGGSKNVEKFTTTGD